MESLTVSKLAELVEVAPDTIRYYEKEGLIPEPDRSTSGYRLYREEAAERVRFIRYGQAMGLKLAQIKELLEIRDQGRCPCGHTTEIITLRLAELDQEIYRLQDMRTQLNKMKDDSVNGIYQWCCPSSTEGEIGDGEATS